MANQLTRLVVVIIVVYNIVVHNIIVRLRCSLSLRYSAAVSIALLSSLVLCITNSISPINFVIAFVEVVIAQCGWF